MSDRLKEIKKAVFVVPLSCMSLILTVLVFGQDGPRCRQRLGLSNLIFRKDTEFIFFSLLYKIRLIIFFLSGGALCVLCWQYFPKSLTVKFVLEVTACLDQESEATQNFSMRYSRGKPPVFLDFPHESLQPLAVTFDTNSRSL